MSDTPYKVRLKTFAVIKAAEAGPLDREPITGAKQASAYLLPFFRAADAGREHFAALYLDTKGRPLAAKILFSGTINESPAYPGEVARYALLLNASAVIVAHTHPSGILQPSADDRVLTQRIHVALATVQIKLLDHLVVCPDTGHYHSNEPPA